jgi:site-specific recombinase XerD
VAKVNNVLIRSDSSQDLIDIFGLFIHLDVAEGNASPDTVKGYFSQVRAWIDWCEESNINPAYATAEDIKHYRQWLVEREYTPGTINHKLVVLRRFYQALYDRHYRPDNPVANIKPPRDRSADDDINYLEGADLARLLNSIPKDNTRDLGIVMLLSLQGCRTVETHRANIDDIREDGSMLIHGKYHDRIIYLRNDTRGILRHILGDSGERVHDYMGKPLFVAQGNRSAGKRLSRRSIRNIVDSYLTKTGLKKPGLSGHALRHTAGTLAYEATRDIRAVQEMLGHKNPKTTGIYAHIINQKENNPAEAINIHVDRT